MTRTFKKRTLTSTLKNLASIYLLLAVITGSLLLLRHHFFVQNLSMYHEYTQQSEEKKFPMLTNQQSSNVGWAHSPSTAPRSSYIHFPKTKSKDTIRIGIFGDSFVQGVEAEFAYDFPSFLQRKYKDYGYSNVEVLNFGVHSYGVHQAFLLWNYVGKFYELDYTIFMPFEFHKARDRSFVFLYNHFAPIHARYILLDHKLKLLPVVGETRVASGRIYNSVVPPWTYIRYDEKPPSFLRMLLPMNRTLTFNPFYYRRDDPDQEILETYTLLFKELAQHDTRSIIICNSKILCSLENDIAPKTPKFLKSRTLEYIADARFLYTAPRTHLSALGNQLRAEELFSFLTGRTNQGIAILRVNTLTLPKITSLGGIPLNESQSIKIEIQGQQVASLLSHRTGQPSWTYDDEVDVRQDNVTSLLRIAGDKNLRMIPVSFPLSDKKGVFLQFELGTKRIQIQVGKVHTTNPYVGMIDLFGWKEGNCFSTNEIKGRVCVGRPDWAYINFEMSGTIHNVELFIGDKRNTILKETPLPMRKRSVQLVKHWLGKTSKKVVHLSPSISRFVMLRAKKGQFIDITNLQAREGDINLVTEASNGESFSHSIVHYKISKASVMKAQVH